MTTFGHDYDEKRDGKRLADQRDAIRDFMLSHGQWLTPREIHQHFAALGVDYPEASVEAQLRHLRKRCFGKIVDGERVAYDVPRRKRVIGGKRMNFSEYAVFEPPPREFQQSKLAFAGGA